MIAPSDMMDNRVAAIKEGLSQAGLGGKACAANTHTHTHTHYGMLTITGCCHELQC